MVTNICFLHKTVSIYDRMLLVAMHDKSKRKTGTAKLDSSFNNWVAYSIRVGEVAGIRQPGGQVVVGGPKMVILLLYTVL